jgi:broad specificity phosphatase PhoE
MYKILFFLLVFFNISANAFSQNTTIWIVRHAEKDTFFVNRKDPELTETGRQRALDLLEFLKGREPSIIFSTNTKRTRQTVASFKAKVQQYDALLLKEFAERVLEFHKGKVILIVGHSNTVLETIEALGGARPVPVLTDTDYDYIFKVSITSDGQIITRAYQYGADHRGGTKSMTSN